MGEGLKRAFAAAKASRRRPLYCSACGNCEYDGHRKDCPDPQKHSVKKPKKTERPSAGPKE